MAIQTYAAPGAAIFAVVMAAIMYVFFEQSPVHKKVSHVAEQEEDGFDEF
ncbi:hypothetical protein [Lactobacillus sp. ESL0230]|nr:hypothetical protein [Lactobacillus sp. ESL0230]